MAVTLEPLEAELAEHQRLDHSQPPAWTGSDSAKPLPHVILPSGNVTISQCAAEIFSLVAPTRSMFIRGGVVTIIDRNDRGEYVLEILRPSAARSRFEKHGRLFAWRVGYRGKEVLRPSICPEETARAIIETQEARDLLPKISGLINCPFLKAADEKLSVSGVGYDEDTGVLVTGGESHLTYLLMRPLLPCQNSSRSLIFNVRVIEVVRSRVLSPRRLKLADSYRGKCQPMWLKLISLKAVKRTVKSLLQPFTTRMSQSSHRRQAEWAAWTNRSPHG